MATNERDEFEINQGNRRRLQRRKPRADEFTAPRRRAFLDHFAATCNVLESAAAVGISPSAVYMRRRKDAGFRLAWALAQEQGYAALEADLVRRSRELLDGTEMTDEALANLSGMDAKLAFSILQNFQKNMGKQPGDIHPKKSDLGEATKRLEKVMRRMKLLDDKTDGRADDQAGAR